MTHLEDLGNVVETDVLVIGGGITGLWAALKAKEHVEHVVIVDKGPRDWGGQASRSGGAMVGVVPPEDDLDGFLEDFVYYYDGICDQKLMEVVLKGSYGIIQELQKLGYNFITDDKGRLKGVPQRALDHVKVLHRCPLWHGRQEHGDVSCQRMPPTRGPTHRSHPGHRYHQREGTGRRRSRFSHP